MVSITVDGLNMDRNSDDNSVSPNLTYANVMAYTNLSSERRVKFILLYISLKNSLNIVILLFCNSFLGIFYNYSFLLRTLNIVSIKNYNEN